jgi:hypothetical protein
MPVTDTVQDFFVTIPPPDAARLAAAEADQHRLENFPRWPDRSDARFLMRLGEDLFRLAFPTPDDVGDLAAELASAVRAGAILRLWIHAPDTRLVLLPWEYLCLTDEAVEECRAQGLAIDKYQPHTTLPHDHTFLALHPHVSLVRQAGPQPPAAELQRLGRLRVLVAWANPASATWPNISGVETEVAVLQSALGGLPDSHVEVRVLDHATPEKLEAVMAEWKPHVLHYAGHGAFPGLDDPGDLAAPSLVLEGRHTTKQRHHAYLTDAALRRLCGRCGVQVVVLNACWGAKATPTFTGLARALTAPGPDSPVPVVVAHQMPIPQTAAAGFAAPFYQNVVVACPIEEGVRTFRTDSVRDSPCGAGAPDWGVPVVYLGVRDSTLFKSERVDAYPLNFGELIRQHVPIVGRGFLRREVARFQEGRGRGIFLLTAPPGAGKTAFLAQLCQDDRDLVHFFYRAAVGVTDPDDWVQSAYHGLLARHGIREQDPTRDRLELRRRLGPLLGKVSSRCGRAGRRELILLDALDESGLAATDHKNAVQVLPEALPPHVFLLVTSRPGSLADELAHRPDVCRFDLDPSSEDNRRDAVAYCERELRGRVRDADEAGLRRLGELLAGKAEGNFLVLKLFLGRQSLGEELTAADLERAAADLTGAVDREYEKFFDRARRAVGEDRVGLGLLYRVLGAFGTARAPVSAEQVCAAFSLPRSDWEWAFGKVGQFLERGGVRQEERGALTYRIYHETFREYLRRRLASDLPDCHRLWGEHGERWRELTGYAQLYALRHVVSHLIAASKGA